METKAVFLFCFLRTIYELKYTSSCTLFTWSYKGGKDDNDDSDDDNNGRRNVFFRCSWSENSGPSRTYYYDGFSL